MRCTWILAGLVLTLPVAGASTEAAPIEAELVVQGVGKFQGILEADARLEGAQYYAANASKGPALALSASRIHYEVWDLPYFRYTLEQGNPAGAQWYEAHLEPELVDSGHARGTLEIAPEFQEEALVRAVSHASTPSQFELRSNGVVEVGRAVPPERRTSQQDIVQQLPREAGDFSLRTAPWRFNSLPEADASGDFGVFIHGVNATLGLMEFTTGQWQDESYAHDPLSWSHGGVWHRFVLLAFGEDADLALRNEHQAAWSMHFTEVEGDWHGDLALSQTQGSGSVNGTPVEGRPHLFQVIGEFHGTADYTETPASWRLDGQATFVAVDSRGIFGNRLGHLDPVAAMTVGLISAGLLGVVWVLVSKRLLEDPLGHGNRRRMMDAIEAHGGLTLRRLQRATGMANGATIYHLQVLRAAGLVERHRSGNLVVYAARGIGDRRAISAYFAQSYELGALLGLIGEFGEASQTTFVDQAARRFGWARSTTRYRLRRLEEGGLVETEVRGAKKMYAAV